MFWVVIATMAVAETAIVVTALRMRVAPDPARGILGARPLEVIWTLLPLLLLVAVALYSYDERRDENVGADAQVVAGEQMKSAELAPRRGEEGP